MKRKLLILFMIITAIIVGALALTACFGSNDGDSNSDDSNNDQEVAVAEIINVIGGTLDNENKSVYILIEKDTKEFSCDDKIECRANNSFRIYNDSACDRITYYYDFDIDRLRDGDNIFYIKVFCYLDNSSDTEIYKLTIHKSFSVDVTYLNKNEVLKTQTSYTGEQFIADYIPLIEGYTFNCWRDEDGNKVSSIILTERISLFADCTAEKYKVNLDVNGGDKLEVNSLDIEYDEYYNIIIPARQGYTFDGWYTDNLKITNNEGKAYARWHYLQDKTFTAHWKVNTYTFDFNKGAINGGIIKYSNDYGYWKNEYDYDSEITVWVQSFEGYTWIGWFDGEELLTSDLSYTFNMPSKNIIYTARWEVYTLTTQVNDLSAGIIMDYNGANISAGKSTTVEAQTNNGYTWLGWYDGEELLTSELTYTFDMPFKSITYTAKWIKVNLVRSNITAGKVCGLDDTYKNGEEASISAETNDGYTWLGWYNGESLLTRELSYTFFMPSENTTYIAKWDSSIPYIDNNGELRHCFEDNIEILTSAETKDLNGWYLLYGQVEGVFSFNVIGEAHLILSYDCDWKIFNGEIFVPSDASLTIYSQTYGDRQGKITVERNIGGGNGIDGEHGADGSTSENIYLNGKAGEAGADGQDCGTVIINGGIITADNIGGGNGGDGGYGGNGGRNSTGSSGGNGARGGAGGNGGDGGNIIINNGIITVTNIGGGNGGDGGGGGGGRNCNDGSRGGDGGAGGNGGSGGTILINGGTITANNIGSGNGGDGEDGGIVGAATGAAAGKNGSWGGNGGDGGNGGIIIISDGTINALTLGCGSGGNGGRGKAGGTGVVNGSKGVDGKKGVGGNNVEIYYKGTQSDWNEMLKPNVDTEVYFYSETEPTDSGNFWHYVDGEITVWEQH